MGTVLNGTDIKPCHLLQQRAVEAFGTLASESNKPYTGATDALTSPQNRKGIQMSEVINDGGLQPGLAGSPRKVQITYIKPTCDGDCPVAIPTECSVPVGTQNAIGYADITVTDNCGWNLQITDADFYKLCEDRDSFIMEQLATKVNQADRNIEKKIITKLNALMGTYTNGVSSVTSPIALPFINADKTPNIGVIATVIEAYMNKGYSDKPIFVSQALNILNLMKPSLGLANSGINLGSLDLSNHFYSNIINSAINAPLSTDDNILTWIPGAFQLLEYSDFKRKSLSIPLQLVINGKTISTAQKQLSTMLLNGKLWDVIYTYDCGVHTWQGYRIFDVFSLPADAVCDNTYPALKFLNECKDNIVCGDIPSSIII